MRKEREYVESVSRRHAHCCEALGDKWGKVSWGPLPEGCEGQVAEPATGDHSTVIYLAPILSPDLFRGPRGYTDVPLWGVDWWAGRADIKPLKWHHKTWQIMSHQPWGQETGMSCSSPFLTVSSVLTLPHRGAENLSQ